MPDAAPPAPEPAGPVAPIHPGSPPADPERPEGLAPTAPRAQDPASAAPAGGLADAETRWKGWGSVVGFFGGFAGAVIGAGIIAAIAGATDSDDQPAWARIASVVVQDISLIGVAVLIAALTAGARPWNFGLRAPISWLRALGWFGVAYLAFVVFSAIWISALDLKNEQDTLPTDFGVQESQAVLLAVGFLVCIVAPFAEEFFFRAFFFRSLVNWAGVWPAAIITGLTFGLVHVGGSPIGFLLPLAFLGFVLCILYWKTRSLLPCIALHCINNCLAYGSSDAVGWTWEIPVAIVVSLSVCGGIVLLARKVWGPAPGPMAPFLSARQS